MTTQRTTLSDDSSAGRRLLAFLAWDGILPLLAAAIPSAIVLLAPGNDVAQVFAAILLPIALALFRCSLGMRQLQQRCGDAVPAFRQLALGTAIVALMLFEGWMSICQFADDEPPGTLAVAALIYVYYLAAMATATRGRSVG